MHSAHGAKRRMKEFVQLQPALLCKAQSASCFPSATLLMRASVSSPSLDASASTCRLDHLTSVCPSNLPAVSLSCYASFSSPPLLPHLLPSSSQLLSCLSSLHVSQTDVLGTVSVSVQGRGGHSSSSALSLSAMKATEEEKEHSSGIKRDRQATIPLAQLSLLEAGPVCGVQLSGGCREKDQSFFSPAFFFLSFCVTCCDTISERPSK